MRFNLPQATGIGILGFIVAIYEWFHNIVSVANHVMNALFSKTKLSMFINRFTAKEPNPGFKTST